MVEKKYQYINFVMTSKNGEKRLLFFNEKDVKL